MKSCRYPVGIALAALLCYCFGTTSKAQDSPPPEVRDDLKWVEVDRAERPKILEMIASQLRGNYEKIRTWKGEYAVSQRLILPESTVAESYQKLSTNPDQKLGALREELEGTIEVAVDFEKNLISRKKKFGRMQFFQVDTGQEVKLKNFAAPDESNIVSAERYTRLDPRFPISRFRYLPDHPEAHGRRAAYVYPAAGAKKQGASSLFDPREFYKFDPENPFWEELEFIAGILRKPPESPEQKEADESVTISQAEGPGGLRMYRHRMWARTPQGKQLWQSAVFSSESAFHPSLYAVTKDTSDGKPESKIEWRWKQVDGIHVPESVKASFYQGVGDSLSEERLSTLKNVVLNRPLDPHEFDVRGLGLKDGELVLDYVDRTVSKIQGDGLVKLGNFGDQGAPARVASGFSMKWVLGLLNVALIGGLIVFRRRIFR